MPIDTSVKVFRSDAVGVTLDGRSPVDPGVTGFNPILKAICVNGFCQVGIASISVFNRIATITTSNIHRFYMMGAKIGPVVLISAPGYPDIHDQEFRVLATDTTYTYFKIFVPGMSDTVSPIVPTGATVKYAPLGWNWAESADRRNTYIQPSQEGYFNPVFMFNDTPNYCSELICYVGYNQDGNVYGPWSRKGIYRHYQASTPNMPWFFAGDSRTLIWGACGFNQGYGSSCGYIGDGVPVDVGDRHFILAFAQGEAYIGSTAQIQTIGYDLSNSTSGHALSDNTGMRIHQNRYSVGANNYEWCRMQSHFSNGDILTGYARSEYSLIKPVSVYQDSLPGQGQILRGQMRGLYGINKNYGPAINLKEVLIGKGENADKTFGVFCNGNSHYYQQMVIDISGPW